VWRAHQRQIGADPTSNRHTHPFHFRKDCGFADNNRGANRDRGRYVSGADYCQETNQLNMNQTEPKTILYTEGFHARFELNAHVDAKAAKLRRHEHPRIGHVRIHIRRETPHSDAPRFSVSASAESRGADFIAHGTGGIPESAINTAFDKLERAVAAATGERKHNLRHSPPVEFSIALPGVI
jgi:ribosome-associated translation inhibitor RaiA